MRSRWIQKSWSGGDSRVSCDFSYPLPWGRVPRYQEMTGSRDCCVRKWMRGNGNAKGEQKCMNWIEDRREQWSWDTGRVSFHWLAECGRSRAHWNAATSAPSWMRSEQPCASRYSISASCSRIERCTVAGKSTAKGVDNSIFKDIGNFSCCEGNIPTRKN